MEPPPLPHYHREMPHISINGIPLEMEDDRGPTVLDDDPLTLDRWEDKERRRKRSAYSVTRETIPKHCDKTAAVDANGTKIVLCLNSKNFSIEDTLVRNYENLTITVYGVNTTRTRVSLKSLGLQYVVGWVIGEVYSSVSGYILDNIFYGSIFVNNDIYYVDPLRKSFTADNQASLYDNSSQPLMMHDSPLAPSRVEPVGTEEEHRRRRRSLQEWGRSSQKQRRSSQEHLVSSRELLRRRRSTGKNDGDRTESVPPDKRKTRKVCGLALVADHIFHKEVGEGDIAATVLQMLYHVKEANAVFLTKDFNNDNKSECLGFQVEAITILETEESYVNILLGKYDVPEDFLRKFSRYNFASYCLGLLFTNRLFKDLVLGLSWRGNPKIGGVGGTCQQRARYREDGKTYSFNALFISMRSKQQSRIPLRMAILNLVHELMHAFGAKHDPDQKERPDCTPSDSEMNGRFLMSKYSNNGRKHNHEVLSQCTKESVVKCLGSKERMSCVQPVSSGYCGDGVVEGDEECDCGDEFQCLLSRACCAPPTGGEDDRPCSARSFCRSPGVDDEDEISVKKVEVIADRLELEPSGQAAENVNKTAGTVTKTAKKMTKADENVTKAVKNVIKTARKEDIRSDRVELDPEEKEDGKKIIKTTRICRFLNIC